MSVISKISNDLDVFSFIEKTQPEAAIVARALLNDSNGIMTRDALYDMIGTDLSEEAITKGIIDLSVLVEVSSTGDDRIGPVIIFNLKRLTTARAICKRHRNIGRWLKDFGLKVAGRAWQIQPKRKEGTAQKLRRLQPSTPQGYVVQEENRTCLSGPVLSYKIIQRKSRRGRPPKAATTETPAYNPQTPPREPSEDT